jgi:hypothetical protein
MISFETAMARAEDGFAARPSGSRQVRWPTRAQVTAEPSRRRVSQRTSNER